METNGLRLTNNADYTINSSTDTLSLTFSPTVGSILSVTTYNLTDRQYLNTAYGGTFGGSSTTILTIGSTTHVTGSYDQDTPVVQGWDQNIPSIVPYDMNLNYLSLVIIQSEYLFIE